MRTLERITIVLSIIGVLGMGVMVIKGSAQVNTGIVKVILTK